MERTSRWPFWRLVALLAILNLLDYVVTVWIFPRVGITEANGLVAPLLHAPFAWPLLALKILLVVAVVLWALASRRAAPEMVRAGLLCVNVLLAMGMLWNGADVLLAAFRIAL